MTTKTVSRRPGMISFQAILFAILVTCHASLRFTNIAVQLVPDSAIVTIAVFLVVGAFWAVDLASPETEKQQQRNQTGDLLDFGFHVTPLIVDLDERTRGFPSRVYSLPKNRSAHIRRVNRTGAARVADSRPGQVGRSPTRL